MTQQQIESPNKCDEKLPTPSKVRRNVKGCKAKDFYNWPEQQFEDTISPLAVQQVIRKDPSNLSEILTPPEGQDLGVTLRDSVSYLDSFIGGGGKKQFLRPATPKHDFNYRKYKTDRCFNNESSSVPKSHIIEADDTKWIEERKKRYPKTICNDSGKIKPDKDDSHCDSNVSKRKKTLFEKLIDSNQ